MNNNFNCCYWYSMIGFQITYANQQISPKIRYIFTEFMFVQKFFHFLLFKIVSFSFSTWQILQVPTAVDRRNLYFNVITNRQGNQTVTVEGAGVNATLIQADIAQMNGYVHIIDRVLGVPFATVYDKLRTDPMLKWVYQPLLK